MDAVYLTPKELYEVDKSRRDAEEENRTRSKAEAFDKLTALLADPFAMYVLRHSFEQITELGLDGLDDPPHTFDDLLEKAKADPEESVNMISVMVTVARIGQKWNETQTSA